MAKLTRAARLFQARVVSELETLTADSAALQARAIVSAQTSEIDLIRAIATERRSDALDQIAAILEVTFAQPSTRTLLCPALRHAKDDPFDIAKRITPTLLTRVIAGEIVALPPEPLLFAAFALAVAHVGASQFCLPDEPLAASANTPDTRTLPRPAEVRADDHEQILRALLEVPVAPYARQGRTRRPAIRSAARWVGGALVVLIIATGASIALFPEPWRTVMGLPNQIAAPTTQGSGTIAQVGVAAPTATTVRSTSTRTAQVAATPHPAAVAAATHLTPVQIAPSAAPSSPTPAAATTGCVPGVVIGTGDLGLNLREAPAPTAAIRAVLTEGSAVTRCEPSTDAEWIRVEALIEGQTVRGWTSAAYVQPLATAGP